MKEKGRKKERRKKEGTEEERRNVEKKEGTHERCLPHQVQCDRVLIVDRMRIKNANVRIVQLKGMYRFVSLWKRSRGIFLELRGG